jgi:hypothetical protein
MKPRWSGATFLHYAGAVLALLATFGLIAALSLPHGDRAALATGWSALAVAVALAAAFLLRPRHALLAGLAGFLALAFVALLAGAFVTWVGIAPDGAEFLQRDFEPGLYLVELAVVAAGLALLRWLAFPLLVAPVVLTLLYVAADVGAIAGAETLFVAVAGLVLVAAAVALEPRPAAFWLHLVGAAAFGGALLHLEWWWAVLAGSLVYVLVGRLLRRSSYAVLAAAGVFLAASHWIGASVERGSGFAPVSPGFGGEPWHVALEYVATGIFTAALGLVASRREEPGDVGRVVVERPPDAGAEPAERVELDGA